MTPSTAQPVVKIGSTEQLEELYREGRSLLRPRQCHVDQFDGALAFGFGDGAGADIFA